MEPAPPRSPLTAPMMTVLSSEALRPCPREEKSTLQVGGRQGER